VFELEKLQNRGEHNHRPAKNVPPGIVEVQQPDGDHESAHELTNERDREMWLMDLITIRAPTSPLNITRGDAMTC
jgi:hypothetical protein